MKSSSRRFGNYAMIASDAVGSSGAFLIACLLVILWAVGGPFFRFSNTWQLMINTTSSIFTFLIVFLIQYAQNRDTRAVQVKLDELLLAIRGGGGEPVLDDLSPEQIARLQKRLEERLGQRQNHSPEA